MSTITSDKSTQTKGSSFDVAIIGAGILGVSIAYWISSLYDISLCIIEREDGAGKHTSSRNTGVIHRPFYLDPEKKRILATAAQKSYSMWQKFAEKNNLPWSQVGTLELATNEGDLSTLDRYGSWAAANGMEESEYEVMDSSGVEKLEPYAKGLGAILSRTDTSVSFGAFTTKLYELLLRHGVKFLGRFEVKKLSEGPDGVGLLCHSESIGEDLSIHCRFLINAAGGGAIDIAHGLDIAKEYTDLHFRGEYRTVDSSFGSKFSRNIYTVAKYKEFSFLDPHLIVRPNGIREIGPNAVLVFDPYAYGGLSSKRREIVKKIFERPLGPKLALFTNRKFLSLVWNEWHSSISTRAMCERAQRFLPSLSLANFTGHGIAGVRSSLIDRKGFVPEAVLLRGKNSFHILNYNSPGATGAPAFSAYVVKMLQEDGYLRSQYRSSSDGDWKFETASDFSLLRELKPS